MRALLSVAVVSLVACLEAPEPPPMFDAGPDLDAEPVGARVHLEVQDMTGRPYPELLPTWPRLVLISNIEIVDESAVVLTHGVSYEALESDLATPPLRASTRAATVQTRVLRDARGVVLQPRHHLARGESYLVGVAPWAFAQTSDTPPFITEVTVDTSPARGAWATDSWPADATFGVPSAMPFVAVRFDGELDIGVATIALLGRSGALPGDALPIDCRLVGWSGGSCARLTLSGPLSRGETYRVVVGPDVTDRTGAPAGPFAAELGVAEVPTEPTVFVTSDCAMDETPAGPACALVDDHRVVLRLSASAPARFFVSSARRSASAVAPRGTARLALEGFSPRQDVALTVALVDLAGREVSRVTRVTTTPPLAPIGITEVRANPLGPEPAQEYVELLNSGAMPIDLAGFSLADRENSIGDIVGRRVIVPAGGRVLLVADRFDPSDPSDPAVPAGVPLARVGASLASGGLSNAGEPLFLRDPEGRRISAAPSVPAPPGACLSRIASDLRAGDAASFETTECTPGRPP